MVESRTRRASSASTSVWSRRLRFEPDERSFIGWAAEPLGSQPLRDEDLIVSLQGSRIRWGESGLSRPKRADLNREHCYDEPRRPANAFGTRLPSGPMLMCQGLAHRASTVVRWSRTRELLAGSRGGRNSNQAIDSKPFTGNRGPRPFAGERRAVHHCPAHGTARIPAGSALSPFRRASHRPPIRSPAWTNLVILEIRSI